MVALSHLSTSPDLELLFVPVAEKSQICCCESAGTGIWRKLTSQAQALEGMSGNRKDYFSNLNRMAATAPKHELLSKCKARNSGRGEICEEWPL